MSNNKDLKTFIIRFLFTILIVAISLKQIQENNQLIKSSQDNVYKAKDLFYSLHISNLGYIYNIIPRLILIMNISLLAAGILFFFQIDGYMLFVNNSFSIQFLLVNNIFLDNSSKCYLIASTYLSLYGCFYYFKK